MAAALARQGPKAAQLSKQIPTVGKQLRRSLHPVTFEESDRRQPWLKYQHGWPQLWLARDQRLLSCQSRFPPSLLLPASCPHPPRWMLPRLALERSPPSWRRESWAPLPPSTSRRPAVSSPLVTVLPVSTASRTSRPRRWWSSAPD